MVYSREQFTSDAIPLLPNIPCWTRRKVPTRWEEAIRIIILVVVVTVVLCIEACTVQQQQHNGARPRLFSYIGCTDDTLAHSPNTLFDGQYYQTLPVLCLTIITIKVEQILT